jgi:hypothetical protein
MSNEQLFSGTAEPLGGLTNEAELAELCPSEFKEANDWSIFAMALFAGVAGEVKDFEWKTDDVEVRKHQSECFRGLLGTFGLGHYEKESVAGWMLSEMLDEVPERVTTEETPTTK